MELDEKGLEAAGEAFHGTEEGERIVAAIEAYLAHASIPVRDEIANSGSIPRESSRSGTCAHASKQEVVDEERRFPICSGTVTGLKKTIPWSVAEKAYPAYCKRGGSGQSLETVARRGGFYESELDEFYPAWREETEELQLLRAEVKRLRTLHPAAKEIDAPQVSGEAVRMALFHLDQLEGQFKAMGILDRPGIGGHIKKARATLQEQSR